MKRTELLFSLALLPFDYLALLGAAIVAHRLRLLPAVEELRPVLYQINQSAYLRSVALAALVWLVFFAAAGLYQRRITDPWLEEVVRIFFACSAGLTSIVFIVFFKRELFSSRFIILAAWGFAILFVTTERFLLRRAQHVLFRYGYGSRRVAVVGSHPLAKKLVDEVRAHPESGYRIVLTLPAEPASLDELRRQVEADAVDELHFVEPAAPDSLRQIYLNFAETVHLPFHYAPDLLAAPVGTPTINFAISVPLIEVPETAIRGWGRVGKRACDVIFSAVAVVVLLPVYAAIALTILLETGRPILYLSERVGRGRSFTLFKFRTMRREYCTGQRYGGEAAQRLHEELTQRLNVRNGPVPKVANDPRVTRVGWWLRRYSLDELPQFVNILRGDMSLVGPRPHLPSEVTRYEAHHRKVLAVKPGLTGLAQVSGRSDLDFEDEVQLDRYYLENWTPLIDITILLKTVPAVLRQRRAL